MFQKLQHRRKSTEISSLYLSVLRQTDPPRYIIDNVGLKKEVATGEQILCDEILIWPYSHTVTHTQRAEHIQDLTKKGRQESMETVISSNVFFQQANSVFNISDLMVASMFIEQRDNWLYVILLDYVQHLWTLNQNTIQHLQDSCHKMWQYISTLTLGRLYEKTHCNIM